MPTAQKALYGDDIGRYANKLTLFKVNLISAARVKISSTSINKIACRFYWILDRKIIVENVKLTDKLGKPLLLLIKLSITKF